MNATGVTPRVPARRQPAGKTAQTLESAHTTGQSSATHFKHHHPPSTHGHLHPHHSRRLGTPH